MLHGLHGLHRRSTATAAGMLLLTVVLSSCGFDYATNRVNTISSSVNNREGAVDVLAVAIISGAPDSGVLVATLANTSTTDAEELGGTTALVDVGGSVTPAEELVPVEIAPLGVDNLYQRGGIPVQGIIGLGDFVGVELTFDNGQVTTLDVPVVRPCYEYNPDQWPAMEIPGPPPPGEPEFEAEGDPAEENTELTDQYSCDPIPPRPFGLSEEGEGGGEAEEGAAE